jgi:crotonobetainyl-CoA:carnitine CoA-transferase CaiB-like acyl-CoA transferase
VIWATKLDLRTPSGQQLVRDLVAHGDILVENFRPGTLEGWGLGWEDLSSVRPELIMVRSAVSARPARTRAAQATRDRRGDGWTARAHRLP